MDALEKYIARRNAQSTWALTIIASLLAIAVEASVISRVWINPVPGHSGFLFNEIPMATALPLLLCLSLQVFVRSALRSGRMSPKIAAPLEILLGLLILVTYQAIGDLMRLII